MSTPTIRVGTLNLLNDPHRMEERYHSAAEELARQEIEVVALQEVASEAVAKEAFLSAGFSHWASAPLKRDPLGERSDAVAVASRIPIVHSTAFESEGFDRPWLEAKFHLESRSMYVATAHFSWGSFSEGRRLEQAVQMETRASQAQDEDPEAIYILAGDLNADEDSRTLRYLRGLDLDLAGRSTYWTDAYHASSGDAWATTQQSKGYWGPRTATYAGILRPELLPDRRIDYLLSRGWRHGRAGGPVRYHVFGQATETKLEISDHLGIWADFLR